MDDVPAILGHVHWLAYFLWVGAVPALVLLGRLTLPAEA
jgi:hypothetical protein